MAQKNNSKTTLIVSAIVLLLAAAVVLFIYNQNTWTWNRSYKNDDDNPYGTIVIHSLLKKAQGSRFETLTDSLPNQLDTDTTNGKSSFIFIGNTFYADSSETKKIIDFISKGNYVYLFTEKASNLLTDSIVKFKSEEEDYLSEDIPPVDEDGNIVFNSNYSSPLTLSLQDSIVFVSISEAIPDYPLASRYENVISPNSWEYFRDNLVSYDGNDAEPLGSFNTEYPNFIRLKFGKGYLYLNSTPLMFSNYSMLSDTAMNYCRQVFSDLGTDKIYWDEGNRYYDPLSVNNPQIPDEGPLEFILSEPSMKKGWYLLLAAGFLYLLFGARRTQRIIPVTENMENTSIEYAGVISQLFMKQSDHKQLILLKMELFKSFLRERFMVRLPQNMKDENEQFYSQVAQRSGIKMEHIQSIFEQYKYLSSIEGVDTPTMLEFHNKIEKFYAQSRK